MSVVKVLSGIASAAVIFLALGVDYFLLGSVNARTSEYVASPWAFSILIFCILVVAQYEFYSMARRRGIYALIVLELLLGAVYLAFSFIGPYSTTSLSVSSYSSLEWWMGVELYWEQLCGFILVIATMAPLMYFLAVGRSHSFESSMASIFGLIYVIVLGSYILKIRFQGIEYALLFVCTAKANDIAGYLLGSTLGRHKMHRESPNKSIEGSIAGIIVGTLIAVLVARLLIPEPFSLTLALIYGVVISITAQLGDLGESMIKRRCNTKDSGNVIPGSGGMLDFVDCLLFSAPVAYYFVEFVAR